MKTSALYLILCAAGLVLPACASAKDEIVSLENCPEPVQKVIRKYSEASKLEEIGLDRKKKSGGPQVYEAKFMTTAGKLVEVTISLEGVVLKTEDKKARK